MTLTKILISLGVVLCMAMSAQAGEPWMTNFGLGTIVHPVQAPATPIAAAANNSKVHIFAIDGLNPMCLGNFNGMCGYIRGNGYPNCNYGQLQNSGGFIDQIRRLRQTDPEAQIVLIGYSLGANYVKSITNQLAFENIKVDMLMYMAADYIGNTPDARPANAGRLVNLRVQGILFTGRDAYFNNEDIDGARNVKLTCRHMLTPSRQETVDVIMQELAMLGGKSTVSTSAKMSGNSVANTGMSSLRIP